MDLILLYENANENIRFVRQVLEGARLLEVSPLFEQAARARGIYSHELMA